MLLKAKDMALADWVKLYGKDVVLSADCSLFPEFKGIRCSVKSAVRSNSNPSVFAVSVIIKSENKRRDGKRMKVDSGMAGLTVSWNCVPTA